MNEFEMVEKLREKANVSFEEAKDALTRANGDLLDAMILLEKEGKVSGNSTATKSFGSASSNEGFSKSESNKEEKKEQIKQDTKEFFEKVWVALSQNFFVIERKSALIGKLPLFAFVPLLIFAFWFTIPALILGLFFECRYKFMGKDDLSVINKAFDKASEATDKVKDEFAKKIDKE